MTSKTENIKPKIMRVFDLNAYERLIRGMQVASCMITESHQIVNEASVLKRLNALTINGVSDGNACSCCGVGPFETREQQIAHYKHHWHTHNLKRRLFGKAPLSLGQYTCRQDDSSVSCSDSDSEASTTPSELFAAATRHCKAFFTNTAGQVFCIYRCILHHKKEHLSADGEGYAWIERCQRLTIPGYLRWAVLMVSGGHFAGAIFSGSTPVVHKTHHSYVTRRGQGQAQSTRDQHGNAPRSAGASLRRYNQAQFIKHVQDIITSWSIDLNGCSLVLYRAVGALNQAVIFDKHSPLQKDDPRVRVLPFPTRKPSFKEVLRVHETVSSIEVYETMEIFQKALMEASTTKIPAKSNMDVNPERFKKPHKIPLKPDRAKSRERTPRELPTQMLSSEDEGPCFIDSETPLGWIKTLSEQSSNGVITNSRKDLLNDHLVCHVSDSEEDTLPTKRQDMKKKKKKKPEERQTKRIAAKIPANIKKMWRIIAGQEQGSLDTILEELESGAVEAACNTQDPADGNTALHKAAIAEKPHLVTQLLGVGGNPCIKNHLLQTPYAASPHSDTRVAFRMFQAEFPDKYNYTKSQIPGPITPEQLEQEKAKKASQKRAKRQREKEKQMEKNKTQHFLQLNDSQKVQAEMPKCFLCGVNLPKKPFEYNSYRFCSIKCLKDHRSLRPLEKSASTFHTTVLY